MGGVCVRAWCVCAGAGDLSLRPSPAEAIAQYWATDQGLGTTALEEVQRQVLALSYTIHLHPVPLDGIRSTFLTTEPYESMSVKEPNTTLHVQCFLRPSPTCHLFPKMSGAFLTCYCMAFADIRL